MVTFTAFATSLRWSVCPGIRWSVSPGIDGQFVPEHSGQVHQNLQFTNISWSDYIIAVAILLTIYYLFVGLRYYTADLKDLVSGKRKLKFRAAMPLDTGEEDAYPAEESYQNEATAFETTTDDDFAEVEHLIERLKNVIADASQKKLIPQEFKQYLHLVLKEYPSLKSSPLRSSVNELIVSECEKHGAVTFSEDEVDMLWKD